MLKCFVFISILIFSSIIVLISGTNCPNGAIPGFTSGICWLLNKNSMNFNDAEKYCKSNKGHLVSIHSAFDNSYLVDQASKVFNQSSNINFFIGGNNLKNHNQWTWVDGSTMDYTDWDPAQPTNFSTKNCMAVSVKTGLWHTALCTLQAPFVCSFHDSASSTFENPILPSGPDPWVLKHNGTYYYTHTSATRIVIYKTKAMSELRNASPVTIWYPPSQGLWSQQIWAPEIHFYDGKFYVYFTADDGNNDNHRVYVIENASPDPTIGAWTFKGKVADTQNDRWAIDSDTFEYNGQKYLVWSGWEAAENNGQNIYIAKLSNPWTVDGNRVKIARPEYDWEMNGAPPIINEGPIGLISPKNQLFITYSASACWSDYYTLGLLSLQVGGDPMNPSHWTKTDAPVFTDTPANGAFGPGHNGFFKSLDDSEYWIIYHANNLEGQGCGDTRNPRMQKFTWNDDDTPNFGDPVAINTPIPKPSGE